MTVFTASFAAVAATVAQDLFEIVAPATARVRLLEVDIGQYTDFGDAAAEILSIQIIRGHTVSGSGGSTVTPAGISPYTAAAGSTVEANNTTVATTSGTTLYASTWQIQDRFHWRPMETRIEPHRRQYLVKPSQRLVVRITAPADSITINGTMTFEEIARAPVS